MDFFPIIEDPRHTPEKQHGYTKEQSSHQAFSSNNQKSLRSSFAIIPPVAKPQNYFASYDVSSDNKFHHAKQQKQQYNKYASLYPCRKSAFLAYRSSLNQKSLEMQTDPPPNIGDILVISDDILKPVPKYATSINQNHNKNAMSGARQITETDIISNNQGDTTLQQQLKKLACSEFESKESPMMTEKKVENLPRLKNFKNILNTFQMASDRILRQQQQRERIRHNTGDHESDQRFIIPDWEKSTEFADSDNIHQYLREPTISIPTTRKNIGDGLPKQWIIQVNAKKNVHATTKPTMSGISSIPPSPLISSHKLSNRTNSPRFGSIKQTAQSDKVFYRNKPAIHQLQYVHSINRSKLTSETEARRNRRIGMPYSSCDCCSIRCTSAESYKRIPSAHIPSHYSLLTSSESRSTKSEMEDNVSVVSLYKQMTANHLEILEYALSHLDKFFVNRNLIALKTNLQKIKLSDLIFESMMPIFSKYSTHFFNAFLPHDSFLSSAINVIAEPIFIHSSQMKFNFVNGNIWNPPTLTEIRAQQDEEQHILRRSSRNQNSQKYRFLIIPRHNLLTFKSFAANYQQIDVIEEYEQKVCFILLQLVCALKSFQLNGIEAISDDLSEFILLCRYIPSNHNIGSMDHLPRILLLQESLRTTNKKPSIGLCDYGLKILSTILNLNNHSPTNFTFPIQECAKALQQDKCSSLTEAKNALEFGIFVGHDAFSFSDEENVQAWIDSKRADYVNYLFREMTAGSCLLNEVYEQLQLQFLLSVTPRALLKMFENMHLSQMLSKTSFYA
ncbi:Protein translocase subunit SecA [Dirofilaria immitis]